MNPAGTVQSRASTPTTAGPGASTTQNADQLNMQTFLQLLTVQLSTQDPLNPVSDTEFFAQMAQMGTVQGIDTLQSTLAASQAAGLIGKTVTAAISNPGTGGATTVTGVVDQMTVFNGQYLLTIKQADGKMSTVSMGNIQSVSA